MLPFQYIYIYIYVYMYIYIYKKWELTENGSLFSLVKKTINGNRSLLCQQTCPCTCTSEFLPPELRR